MTTTGTLTRTTFETSRLMEFFTKSELAMQLGYDEPDWPIALLKEVIDNSLDACEQAAIVPEIEVRVEPHAFSVQDNGPGLPESILDKALDYSIRVSNKANYISPTRGRLGNALKCLIAAPFVADGSYGRIEIITNGVQHTIEVTLDRIAQQPTLSHSATPVSVVKNGTFVKIHWPEVASYLAPTDEEDCYNVPRGHGRSMWQVSTLLQQYAACNPHATFTYLSPSGEQRSWTCTAPSWQKWHPKDPTSPHWYTEEQLRGLIAAYVTEERKQGKERSVREFVSEFNGLKGTAKQKAVGETTGLAGTMLHELANESGTDIDMQRVTTLLAAMKQESRPLAPALLGVLGSAHVMTHLESQYHLEHETLRYKKIEKTIDGVPFVVEVAMGWSREENRKQRPQYCFGVNFSPALRKHPFAGIADFLAAARIQPFDPVVVFVHCTSPRLRFVDRGKTQVILPQAIGAALKDALVYVAKQWIVFKRNADREDRVQWRDQEQWLKKQQRAQLSIKTAAYRVMEQAYLKASANGTLPANARQIMYAARPLVLRLTRGACWKDSAYFTQHLLPDFIEEHPERTDSWDVAYDARGTMREPHTRKQLGLGTLEVRKYTTEWTDVFSEALDAVSIPYHCPTRGPGNRYRYVLFVEKEGFHALLDRAQIVERFDIAIMSTKGMSVVAARQLVESFSTQGVTVLVLHDFDKSGFSIVHTLRSDTRRHRYTITPRVIDLGLRLDDTQHMGLESEDVTYGSGVDPRINLRESGATPAECDFLVSGKQGHSWVGKRVELNAMDSGQFVTWLENKLIAHGVHKFVPDEETLQKAFRRAVCTEKAQRAIRTIISTLNTKEESIALPPDLVAQVQARIIDTALPWDEGLQRIAREYLS
ncbi:MAG: hypothetical protein AB7G75_30060 [Candidatus Binatia bacterium]